MLLRFSSADGLHKSDQGSVCIYNNMQPRADRRPRLSYLMLTARPLPSAVVDLNYFCRSIYGE